jgi:hypothetical protein
MLAWSAANVGPRIWLQWWLAVVACSALALAIGIFRQRRWAAALFSGVTALAGVRLIAHSLAQSLAYGWREGVLVGTVFGLTVCIPAIVTFRNWHLLKGIKWV